MYSDRKKNWDYNPANSNPSNGTLHADHSTLSRSDALKRGLPIPPPDRLLLHGTCNIQRGSGANDHLAASRAGDAAKLSTSGVDTAKLAMPWPW
jgi:hypothetical protein